MQRQRHQDAPHESPGFNAGRGLKPSSISVRWPQTGESPGFNAGRGLKPLPCFPLPLGLGESPGFNAGRGLKQRDASALNQRDRVARL